MHNPRFAQSDNVGLAVFSIVLAVFSLSLGDAVIKSLSISFPLWQVYVVRSVIALIILLGVTKLLEPTLVLMPRSIGWTLIRSFLLAVMWVAYYSALPHIKLSVAAAIYYTIPLFITLFSAVVTGERVSAIKWFAIALGFAGVIIIVRPDAGEFNNYALLPLAAAILYALAMMLTRTKCRHESPTVLSLALNVVFIFMGVVATLVISLWSPDQALVDVNPFLLGAWTQLDSKGWLAMCVLGVAIVLGSLFTAIAYQNGPPSTVASFDYSYLAFSILWGLLFFAEVPDPLSILGIVMIAGAGLIAVKK